MPHASFSSPTGGEPVTFDLNGTTFHCHARLPAGTALDLITGGGSGVDAARRVGEFFQAALLADEAELFAAAIRDPEVPVPTETLNAIVEWLVREYTGRPTGLPPDSGNGRQSTEPTSTDVASSLG